MKAAGSRRANGEPQGNGKGRAVLPGLRYACDEEPGIRRRRAGRHFRYHDARGRPIRDREELARIAALAVPPAYRDVWICADARGHLQATGFDARGRKQYRYHPRWRALRDRHKFVQMTAFARALPRLRQRLRRDLRREGLPREKVLATVVALLDRTHARIGNGSYAKENGSYGLSTLRDRHARFAAGRLRLRFTGKGGAEHVLDVDDRRLARIVRRCQQLPGQTLFQYVDDDGAQHAIDSGQVNAYLHEAMGAAFSAKDFRTWSATLHAAAELAATPLPQRGGERAARRCINAAISEVAGQLRNTPAVCRKSYINPLVYALWRCGELHRAGLDLRRAPRRAEQQLIRLLRRPAADGEALLSARASGS